MEGEEAIQYEKITNELEAGDGPQSPATDVLESLQSLTKRRPAELRSWLSDQNALDVQSSSETSVDTEIVIRYQQYCEYLARNGLVEMLCFALSVFPVTYEPAFRIFVLEEIPVDISPEFFWDAMPNPNSSVWSDVFLCSADQFPKSFSEVLKCGWNYDIPDGPQTIQIYDSYAQAVALDEFDVRGYLLRWYISMALRYDSLGYTYHGYLLLQHYVATTHDTTSSTAEEGKIADYGLIYQLNQLRCQFYHFCHLLYDDLIPTSTLLVDWVCGSLEDKLGLIISHNFTAGRGGGMALTEILGGYVIPWLQGDLAVDNAWEPLILALHNGGSFVKCTAATTISVHRCVQRARRSLEGPPRREQSDPVPWPLALARALASTVTAMDLPALLRVVEVAATSKPTLPAEERRLPSNAALVELVVRSCWNYDDVHTGMEAMWQLVECTPTGASGTGRHGREAYFLRELDRIERALNTCEILKPYIPVPALSILLPPVKGDQPEETDLVRSVAQCKLLRFRYTQQLLSGCSFLFDRVEAARRESKQGDGVARDVEVDERVDRKIKFGQALVMKVCHTLGEKMEVATREGAMSFLVSNTWLKLAEDLAALCKVSVFQSEVTAQWAGELLLACLLHFRSAELRSVLSNIFKNGTMSQPTEGSQLSPKKDLSAALVGSFGVTAAVAQALVLNHARFLTNSVASSWDDDAVAELKVARDLLRLIPENDRTVETRAELRLHEVLRLTQDVKMDFIPLQLRLQSPVEIARKILTERPQAYYTLVQFAAEEPSQAAGRPVLRSCSTLSEAKKHASDLKSRPIPGQGLVEKLLGLLQGSREEDADSEARVLEHTMRLVVLLAGAALAVGDVEHAYRYCSYLLDEYRFNSAEAALQDDIISTTTLVMEAVGNPDYQSDPVLGRALREDLMCSIASTGSIEQFDRLTHLWRSTEPLPSVASSAGYGGNLLQEVVEDKLNALDNAKVVLYDAIAVLLKRGRWQAAGTEDDVVQETSLCAATQEALCYMTQVSDTETVVALIDGMLSDIRRKIVKVQQLGGVKAGPDHVLPPDERMIQQLVSKGFPRNGAKRAVLHTRATSLDAALAWAIEHCADPDFDHPMAQHVRGAILTEEAARHETSLRNLRAALSMVQAVGSTYRLLLGLPPAADEEQVGTEASEGAGVGAGAVKMDAASMASASPAPQPHEGMTSPPRPTRRADKSAPRAAKTAKKPTRLGARRITAEDAAGDTDSHAATPLSVPDSTRSAVSDDTASSFSFTASSTTSPVPGELAQKGPVEQRSGPAAQELTTADSTAINTGESEPPALSEGDAIVRVATALTATGRCEAAESIATEAPCDEAVVQLVDQMVAEALAEAVETLAQDVRRCDENSTSAADGVVNRLAESEIFDAVEVVASELGRRDDLSSEAASEAVTHVAEVVLSAAVQAVSREVGDHQAEVCDNAVADAIDELADDALAAAVVQMAGEVRHRDETVESAVEGVTTQLLDAAFTDSVETLVGEQRGQDRVCELAMDDTASQLAADLLCEAVDAMVQEFCRAQDDACETAVEEAEAQLAQGLLNGAVEVIAEVVHSNDQAGNSAMETVTTQLAQEVLSDIVEVMVQEECLNEELSDGATDAATSALSEGILSALVVTAAQELADQLQTTDAALAEVAASVASDAICDVVGVLALEAKDLQELGFMEVNANDDADARAAAESPCLPQNAILHDSHATGAIDSGGWDDAALDDLELDGVGNAAEEVVHSGGAVSEEQHVAEHGCMPQLETSDPAEEQQRNAQETLDPSDHHSAVDGEEPVVAAQEEVASTTGGADGTEESVRFDLLPRTQIELQPGEQLLKGDTAAAAWDEASLGSLDLGEDDVAGREPLPVADQDYDSSANTSASNHDGPVPMVPGTVDVSVTVAQGSSTTLASEPSTSMAGGVEVDVGDGGDAGAHDWTGASLDDLDLSDEIARDEVHEAVPSSNDLQERAHDEPEPAAVDIAIASPARVSPPFGTAAWDEASLGSLDLGEDGAVDLTMCTAQAAALASNDNVAPQSPAAGTADDEPAAEWGGADLDELDLSNEPDGNADETTPRQGLDEPQNVVAESTDVQAESPVQQDPQDIPAGAMSSDAPHAGAETLDNPHPTQSAWDDASLDMSEEGDVDAVDRTTDAAAAADPSTDALVTQSPLEITGEETPGGADLDKLDLSNEAESVQETSREGLPLELAPEPEQPSSMVAAAPVVHAVTESHPDPQYPTTMLGNVAPAQLSADILNTTPPERSAWDEASLGSLEVDDDDGAPEQTAVKASAGESTIADTALSSAESTENKSAAEWGDLDQLDISAESEGVEEAASVGCSREYPLASEPASVSAEVEVETPHGREGLSFAVAPTAPIAPAQTSAETVAASQPAPSAWEEASLGSLDLDETGDVTTSQPIAHSPATGAVGEGWGDDALDDLDFGDGEEPLGGGEDRIITNDDDERDAERTAIIESALESAAELLNLSSAAFNATTVAMHIAAFDPLLHPRPNSQHREAHDEDGGDGTMQSLLSVLDMVCTLATSEQRHASGCLSQLLVAIPYPAFHLWLAEMIEHRELGLSDSAERALPRVLFPQEASTWCVAALKFKASFTRSIDAAGIETDLAVLRTDPIKFLLLLSRLYDITSSHDLAKIEFTKKVALDILNDQAFSSVENATGLLDQLIRGKDHITTSVRTSRRPALEVLESIKQQLGDDIASLRRIARVEASTGVDCKALIQSETLLSSTEVFGRDQANEARLKLVALRSVVPVLRLHTVAAWNRAVGRLLDVGPSLLHTLFALNQVSLCRAGEVSVPDLQCALSSAAAKIKYRDMQAVCLYLAGVDVSRIDELLRLSLSPVLTTEEVAGMPIMASMDATDLLQAIADAITASTDSGSKGTRAEKSLSDAETSGICELIATLQFLLRNVGNLPREYHVRMLTAAMAHSCEIIESSALAVLADCDAPVDSAVAACTTLAGVRPVLARMFALEDAQDRLMLDGVLLRAWNSVCSSLRFSSQNGADTAATFLKCSAALRSVLGKALLGLSADGFGSFLSAVLVDVSAWLPSPVRSGAAALLDISLTDETSWLKFDVLNGCTGDLCAKFVAIHVLSGMAAQLHEKHSELTERVLAVRRLLLARCTIADLCAAGVLSSSDAFILSQQGLLRSEMGDSSLLGEVLTAAARCADDEALRTGATALVSLSRLYRESQSTDLLCPENLVRLRNALRQREDTMSSSDLEPQLCILKLLLRAQAYSLFVEYVLVDMQLADRVKVETSESLLASIRSLSAQLPAGSPWQRQVKILLGGAGAEEAFAELEALVSQGMKGGSHNTGGMGDALTLLLVLWRQPSPAIVQRTLASPVLYPLLATLVVQLDWSRWEGGGVRVAPPYTLDRLIAAALRPNSDSAVDAEFVPLPERWRARYLIALLVHHGRTAAAAELCWRVGGRPRAMFSSEAGRQNLLMALRRWKSEDAAHGIYNTAHQLLSSVSW